MHQNIINDFDHFNHTFTIKLIFKQIFMIREHLHELHQLEPSAFWDILNIWWQIQHDGSQIQRKELYFLFKAIHDAWMYHRDQKIRIISWNHRQTMENEWLFEWTI